MPDVRTPQDAKGSGKFGMATLERHNEEDAWRMKDEEPTPTAQAEASQPRRRENRVCTLRATERHGSRDGDVAVGAANQNRVRVSERADRCALCCRTTAGEARRLLADAWTEGHGQRDSRRKAGHWEGLKPGGAGPAKKPLQEGVLAEQRSD